MTTQETHTEDQAQAVATKQRKARAPKMAPPTQAQAVAKTTLPPSLPAALQGMPGTDSAALAAAGMMGLIDKLATNPDVDVVKMQALLEMQLGIWDRMAKMAYSRDFSALSLVLPRIVKKGSVEYEREKGNKAAGMQEAFKFALLEHVDDVVRPLLPQYGFSISFTTRVREGGGLISVGTLTHRDGHETVCELPLAIDTSGGKNNLQGMGSTASYGVRYGHKILLNLIMVDEDDDGKGAGAEIIDTEKAAEIDTKLREKEKSLPEEKRAELRPRFLAHMGVDDIRKLKAKDYTSALTAIAAIGQKPQQKKA